MPDTLDRTDHARIANMADSAISYDDIPSIDDDIWLPSAPRKPSLHVFHGLKGWVVRASGATRSQGVFTTQSAAVKAATDKARARQGSIAVHGKDGRLRLFRDFAA